MSTRLPSSLPPYRPQRLWAVLAGVATLTLAACQTTPPRNAELEQARQLVQTASTSPDVAAGAPLELERARRRLQTAEKNWADERDERETRHLAYLAAQQAQVALNVGAQYAADRVVAGGGTARAQAEAEAQAQRARQAEAQARSAGASAQSASERARLLEQALREMAAKPTDRGMVMVLQDVLFDVGRAELREGGRARLEKLAQVMSQFPERKIIVEGYTDSTGSDASNQSLSERRADSVKQALVGMGIPAERIETKGFGEARPVANNKTPAGRQQNRRVELVFSQEDGRFANPNR